jgi:hypothetical protein
LVKDVERPGGDQLPGQIAALAGTQQGTRSQRVGASGHSVGFHLARNTQEDIVIDIGAGKVRWSMPLAGKARMVSAVEPASEMAAMLDENIQKNSTLVREQGRYRWPDSMRSALLYWKPRKSGCNDE